jgi:hypothetical protein
LPPLAPRGTVTDSSTGTRVMDPSPGGSQSVRKHLADDDGWRHYDAKRPRVGRGGARRVVRLHTMGH